MASLSGWCITGHHGYRRDDAEHPADALSEAGLCVGSVRSFGESRDCPCVCHDGADVYRPQPVEQSDPYDLDDEDEPCLEPDTDQS